MMRTLFWRLFSSTMAVAHQKSSSFVMRSNLLSSTQRAALDLLPLAAAITPFVFCCCAAAVDLDALGGGASHAPAWRAASSLPKMSCMYSEGVMARKIS